MTNVSHLYIGRFIESFLVQVFIYSSILNRHLVYYYEDNEGDINILYLNPRLPILSLMDG